MGFIQPRREEDPEQALGAYGGRTSRIKDQDSAVGGHGLEIDLELRACAVCRRELLPWQETCPDDGGQPVLREQLPAPEDAILARLLEEDTADDGGPSDDTTAEPTEAPAPAEQGEPTADADIDTDTPLAWPDTGTPDRPDSGT